MIVSSGWNLQLGDIRGAFLEADALDRKQGPLYSSLPPGGIPGVPDGAVILFLEVGRELLGREQLLYNRLA